MDERYIRLIERNAAGKIKGRVEKVLDLQIAQLEGALFDRKEPNLSIAKSSINHLKELLDELRKGE